MEYENKHFASKGVGGTALGLAIGSLGLQTLNGGLGGILGGGSCGCSEDRLINRYELGQESRISELQSQIALRDANTYNDQKMLEMSRTRTQRSTRRWSPTSRLARPPLRRRCTIRSRTAAAATAD